MTIENASVVKVYQPDYFLWRQSFKANCACEGQERSLVVNHLPAMLRINFAKLKENSKWQKCCLCNKPMTEEVKQRVFFPCQRVDIHLPNFSNQKRNELYPLWLINDDICKLKKGDVLSAVVYYDIYVDYTLNNGRMLGAMHDFFIGYHLAKMSLSRNQKFFSELISKLGASSLVELEFLSYDIKNYDYILSRWQNVSKCLSNLSGDFLKSEIISLNFALLLSITLMNKSSLKPAIDFHSVGKFHVEKVKNYPEYIKKVEEIKEKYNSQLQSDFLKYGSEHPQDIKGARHEVGGVITNEEKKEFFERLEKRIENRKKKIERQVKKADNPAVVIRKLYKSFDAEKRQKAFLNRENRILFKEVLAKKQS